jgi:hypothetical protein
MTKTPYKRPSTSGSEVSKRSAVHGRNYTPAVRQQDPDLAQVTLLLRNHLNLKHVAEQSGVSVTCMRKWMKGETKRPYNVTITFVMRAMGYGKRWSKP